MTNCFYDNRMKANPDHLHSIAFSETIKVDDDASLTRMNPSERVTYVD